MNAAPALHPTDQTLSSYGLGKLDDAAAESVHQHLESCPECRRRVAELPSDSFLGRLQDAKPRPDSPSPVVSASDGLSMLDAGVSPETPLTASTLPPGLADHPDYEITRELGRGGMGVVYLAQNTLMGRPEVLKVVSSHLVSRPDVLDRFLREIRSAAKLHHTNIVTAYSALRLGDTLVLSMEYVEGHDLARVVKDQGPLPLVNACYYINQAALGLQHAHEHGMVHRDIKPANLILWRGGKRAIVKVLDFGLAKVTREGHAERGLTREGQMLGTPDYIAPEQIRNAQSADIRADIYSLGCTFYYLLTGGPPFGGDSLWDVYQAHFSMDASPLNLVRPEVPVELAALVAKMMAKDPTKRFQTPGDVAQALVPFFKPSVSQPSRASTEVSRNDPPVNLIPASGVRLAPAPPATPGPAPAPVVRKPSKTGAEGVVWESLIEFQNDEPLIEAVKPKVAPTSAPVRRPPWAWVSVATGVMLFGLVAAWLAGVFRVRTPDGDLVFDGLPAESVVTVDGKVCNVEWPGGQGPAKVSVPAGEHKVQVEINGVTVHGEDVKIAAGDKKWINVRWEPRGVTPPADESISRTLTDSMLVIKGWNESIIDNAKMNFPVQIDPNIKATFRDDKIYINEVFGRKNVLCMAPFSESSPGTIDFSRITKDGTGSLTLLVHGYPIPGGGRIVVKSDGVMKNDSTVEFGEGWKRIVVPFRRNEIVVEHHAIGWNMEFLFVDYSVVGDSTRKPSGTPRATTDEKAPGAGTRTSPDGEQPARVSANDANRPPNPTEPPKPADPSSEPKKQSAEAVEPGKPIPPGPFRVATNGLAGTQFIDPVNFGPDPFGFNEPGTAVPWATRDAFARLTTSAALGYPRLPASRYVCEVELTVHKRGIMMFCLGDARNRCEIDFWWNPEREIIECKLWHHDYGGARTSGLRDVAPERPISLKLAVGDGKQTLFHENKPILSADCWPTDCCLVLWSGTPDSAVIHRCSLRPLTAKDVADCGWTNPPTDLAVTLDEEAARRARISEAFGGADKQPNERYNAAARLAKISEGYPAWPEAGKRFAVTTTGTPMTWIPPGEFEMGSRAPNDEGNGRHRVRLTKGYWIAQVEVIQGEYNKVAGGNPSRITGSPYLPVDWVAWDQAAAYCRKLTDLERKAGRLPGGYEYRLPTEAEWEYACRAGSDEDFSVPEALVWSRDPSGCRPHEVAESPPNKWGLYDMHGNAMEWCLDAWYDYPKGKKEVTVDPFKIGQPDKDTFVVRGGAWWIHANACASHWRYSNHNNPNGFRGFRIVLGPEIRDPERKPLAVASHELKKVDQDGFVPLFNGKDFAGMGDPSREDFAGSRVIRRDNGVSWVVKDGTIMGQGWNNVRMFDNMLIIGRKGSVFRNFHLRVNMAINRGGHATVVARNAVREVRPNYLTLERIWGLDRWRQRLQGPAQVRKHHQLREPDGGSALGLGPSRKRNSPSLVHP